MGLFSWRKRPVVTREEVESFARETERGSFDHLNHYNYVHYLATKLLLERLKVPEQDKRLALQLNENEAHLARLYSEIEGSYGKAGFLPLSDYARNALITHQNLFSHALSRLSTKERERESQALGKEMDEIVHAHARFATEQWWVPPRELYQHLLRVIRHQPELRRLALGKRYKPFEKECKQMERYLLDWFRRAHELPHGPIGREGR